MMSISGLYSFKQSIHFNQWWWFSIFWNTVLGRSISISSWDLSSFNRKHFILMRLLPLLNSFPNLLEALVDTVVVGAWNCTFDFLLIDGDLSLVHKLSDGEDDDDDDGASDLDLWFAWDSTEFWLTIVLAASSNTDWEDLLEHLVSVSTYMTALIFLENERARLLETGCWDSLEREARLKGETSEFYFIERIILLSHLRVSFLRSAWQPTRITGVCWERTEVHAMYREWSVDGDIMLKQSITRSTQPRLATSSGLLASSMRSFTLLPSTMSILV